MKILSFNTYSATTMPNRHSRRQLLLDKITQWDREGVDIVCLQEQNSHKVGCFTKLLYKFFKCRMLDCLSAAEGLCCPLFTYDNESHIRDHIDDNNLGYRYVYTSPRPKYFLNSGLMVLSKTPLNLEQTVNLDTDCVHVPGIITLSNDEYQITNCHLIPELSNIKCSYSAVLMCNKLVCKDVQDIQRRNIDQLCQNLDTYKKVIVLGDLNIDKEDIDGNYGYLMERSGLVDSSGKEACPTVHYNCERDKQIDYILVSEGVSGGFEVRKDCMDISDHHPVILTI